MREGGARSVMNSYSEIDALPVAADAQLLTGVLRDEWGFEGMVVSDYWSIVFLRLMHRVAASPGEAGALSLAAGIDVELPAHALLRRAAGRAWCARARVPEELVDRAARRVLRQKAELGLLDPDWTPTVPDGPADIDPPEHRALARELAERSVVLLANDGTLPLARHRQRRARRPVRRRPAGRSSAATRTPTTASWRATRSMRARDRGADAARRAARRPARRHARPRARLPDPGRRPLAARGRRRGRPRRRRLHRGRRRPPRAVRARHLGRGLRRRGPGAARHPGRARRGAARDRHAGRARRRLGPPVRARRATRTASRPRSRRSCPGRRAAAAIAGVLSGRVVPAGKLPVQVPKAPGRAARAPTCTRCSAAPAAASATSTPTPLFAFGHGLSYTTFEYAGFALSAEEIATDGEVEVSCVCQRRRPRRRRGRPALPLGPGARASPAR